MIDVENKRLQKNTGATAVTSPDVYESLSPFTEKSILKKLSILLIIYDMLFGMIKACELKLEA